MELHKAWKNTECHGRRIKGGIGKRECGCYAFHAVETAGAGIGICRQDSADMDFIPAVLKNLYRLWIDSLFCPNIHKKGNGYLLIRRDKTASISPSIQTDCLSSSRGQNASP